MPSSDVITRARATSKAEDSGYISAPSTDIQNQFGVVFLNCRLLKEPAKPENSSAPGRPWHPTTSFVDGRYADPNAIGSSVFIHTYMDRLIAIKGWKSMRGTSHVDSKSAIFEAESARFFAYASSGPGAAINPHRCQLSNAQAAKFTLGNIFNG